MVPTLIYLEKEKELYGTKTLKEIEIECCEIFKNDKLSLSFSKATQKVKSLIKFIVARIMME